jgi:hypothetical protein
MELYCPGVGRGKTLTVKTGEGVSPPSAIICGYHARMVKRLFPGVCQETERKSIMKFFSMSPLLEILVLQDDLKMCEKLRVYRLEDLKRQDMIRREALDKFKLEAERLREQR